MSAYGLTPAHLKDRFGAAEVKEILTRKGQQPPSDEVIDATCQKCIDEFEADMHVAAGVYYVVPITPREDAAEVDVEALFDSLEGKILEGASYKLMQHKPAILNAGEKALYWSQTKKALDAWLVKLQTGDEHARLTLLAATPRAVVETSTGGAWAESDENLFSRDRMRGFV